MLQTIEGMVVIFTQECAPLEPGHPSALKASTPATRVDFTISPKYIKTPNKLLVGMCQRQIVIQLHTLVSHEKKEEVLGS